MSRPLRQPIRATLLAQTGVLAALMVLSSGCGGLAKTDSASAQQDGFNPTAHPAAAMEQSTESSAGSGAGAAALIWSQDTASGLALCECNQEVGFIVTVQDLRRAVTRTYDRAPSSLNFDQSCLTQFPRFVPGQCPEFRLEACGENSGCVQIDYSDTALSLTLASADSSLLSNLTATPPLLELSRHENAVSGKVNLAVDEEQQYIVTFTACAASMAPLCF